MQNAASENLHAGLRIRDRAAIMKLLRSEAAKLVYVACHKACLNEAIYANALFGRVMRSAIRKLPGESVSEEEWLFTHFHAKWLNFAEEHKKRLGIQPMALTFDWKILNKIQAEDAMLKLNPDERAIYIYRFFLKFGIGAIAVFSGHSESRVSQIFRQAMEKVIPS